MQQRGPRRLCHDEQGGLFDLETSEYSILIFVGMRDVLILSGAVFGGSGDAQRAVTEEIIDSRAEDSSGSKSGRAHLRSDRNCRESALISCVSSDWRCTDPLDVFFAEGKKVGLHNRAIDFPNWFGK